MFHQLGACCHIFYGSLISIARIHCRQSFCSQLIYIEVECMITKMNYGLFFSKTQGHIDYNGNSQRNFGNTLFNLHHMCFVSLNYFATYTRIQIWKEKRKKTSCNRWCAGGCWFSPITNRGRGEENCWHLFMGNSFMVQSSKGCF